LNKIVIVVSIIFMAASITAQQYALSDFLKAEGIEDHAVLARYTSLHTGVISRIKEELADNHTVYRQHKKLYRYLHDTLFKKYSNIPFLSIIFDAHYYNYLTATILYTLITDSLGHSYQIYANQMHVYLIIFDPETNEFYVDLTNPDYGFDSKNDQDALLKIMAFHDLITDEAVARMHKDELCTTYFQSSYPITRDDLLILYYIHIALSHHSKKAYEEAFKSIAAAFRLKPTFPPVQNFFLSLWCDYRNRLYQDANFVMLDSLLIGYTQLVSRQKTLKQEHIAFIKKHITTLMNENDDYKRAIELLIKLSPFVEETVVRELEQLIYAGDVETFLEQGNILAAVEVIAPLYLDYPQVHHIKNLFTTTVHNLMEQYVNAGRFSEVTRYLDSLLVAVPNDTVIKKLYSDVLLSEMSINNIKYIENPTDAESLLIVAFTMDPHNIAVRQTLIYLYHLRAMEFTREDDLERAKNEVEKGLAIDPENRDLLEDLRLINEQLGP
jgi:tetratricopeptide (TPR) repeat protein